MGAGFKIFFVDFEDYLGLREIKDFIASGVSLKVLFTDSILLYLGGHCPVKDHRGSFFKHLPHGNCHGIYCPQLRYNIEKPFF